MDPKSITKTYTNGEVTVVWKPGACIHSTICWKEATGLPEVFNPRARPWIKIDGSTTEKIVAQVQKCPSGALSFYYNIDGPEQVATESKVEVLRNGPLLVYGNLTIKDQFGNETKKSKVTAFCRCGLSGNKPYCDGSYIKAKIDG
jgi:uncharacterized Fe-S cluster protein YjdI